MTISEKFPRLQSETVRYAVPVCAVVITTAGCLFSKEVVKFPYLVPFMVAVAASSFFGLGPALVALVLSMLLSDFFLIPPIFSLSLDHITLLAAGHYALAAFLVIFGARAAVRKGLDQKLRLIFLFLRENIAPAPNNGDASSPCWLGRLDGDVEGEIFGWAVDTRQSSLPPKITVYVEDRPVGEVGAVHYRSDVGSHCYYFDLAQAYPPATAARVEARFPNGRRLPNSPLLVNIPAARPVRHSETVLFMHISKTAGTAFREAMIENYRKSEVAYLYPDAPGFLCDDLALLPLEQRGRFRLVVGHFQYGIHQFLPRESTYVTIVRDPVSRVISEFRYLIGKQPNSAGTRAGSPEHLLELLERRETIPLDNQMVRCFSGVSEKDFPAGHIDEKVYELAVRNLDASFSFVGHQERSTEAYAALQKTFHWKPRALEEVNRGAAPGSESYECIRSTIEHFNRWDCQLYSEICSRFP